MNKAGLTILGLIALSSCSNIHPHTNDTIISDTVPYDYVLDDVANVKEYVDSIHMLSRFLVEQEDYLLFDDKAEWEAYETAMSYSKNAFIAHDYYSSLDLALAQFEIEFLEQRLISLVDLCGYLKGTPVSDSRHNAVTNSMIDNAYGLFLDAIKHCTIYEDYEDSVIVKMNNALNEEQKAWKRWINEREIVASRLNGEAKKIYINSTNELKRKKLIQLLNQYQGYGINSQDIWNHLLSDDCTDKQLNDYPGFNKMWENYLDSVETDKHVNN